MTHFAIRWPTYSLPFRMIKPATNSGMQIAAWLILMFLWASLIFGSYRYVIAPESCALINKLPYAISEPGCYKLAKDVLLPARNSVGISIDANRVSLDLDMHHIDGPKQPATASIGVSVLGGRDIIIQNGTISGFLYGVRVEGGSGLRKTERFELNSVMLTDNFFRGAAINGMSSIVRNVTVQRTGGTTLFPSAYATGIELIGRDCRVIDNVILETHTVGTGEAKGLALIENNGGCVVHGNKIQNVHPGMKNRSTGIWSRKENGQIDFSNNRIKGFEYENFRY